VFVIIVGGGKVGTYLARALLDKDHEVVVVEKLVRKAEHLSNILEQDVAVVGDGCDPLVLAGAGIARADFVIADTGDDEDNLVVSLIAKKQSKARCIARVNNPRNKPIFESIDRVNPVTVVSSTEIILAAIDQHVNVLDYSVITRLRDGQVELVKVTIPKGSAGDGRRIVDINLPRNTIVVAIDRKNDDLIIPSGETTVRCGDEVIVICKQGQRDDVRAAFNGPPVQAARR
jgi:trk system potassium uptake protein TrkA